MRRCLDSWAVLRWLEGVEPAAARVDEILAERPVMSWVNLGEVFYVVLRRADEATALEVVSAVRGAVEMDPVTPERVLEAGRVKAAYPMALADAYAVATAQAHQAVLVTGDPEIVEAGGLWRVEDLR